MRPLILTDAPLLWGHTWPTVLFAVTAGVGTWLCRACAYCPGRCRQLRHIRARKRVDKLPLIRGEGAALDEQQRKQQRGHTTSNQGTPIGVGRPGQAEGPDGLGRLQMWVSLSLNPRVWSCPLCARSSG